MVNESILSITIYYNDFQCHFKLFKIIFKFPYYIHLRKSMDFAYLLIKNVMNVCVQLFSSSTYKGNF